jgi:hypothetical protein
MPICCMDWSWLSTGVIRTRAMGCSSAKLVRGHCRRGVHACTDGAPRGLRDRQVAVARVVGDEVGDWRARADHLRRVPARPLRASGAIQRAMPRVPCFELICPWLDGRGSGKCSMTERVQLATPQHVAWAAGRFLAHSTMCHRSRTACGNNHLFCYLVTICHLLSPGPTGQFSLSQHVGRCRQFSWRRRA